MGTRKSYAPGTFSWIDLGTTDAMAAKHFYGRLFGWTFQDMPAGQSGTYSMIFLGEHSVAALFEMGPEMRQHVPTAWQSYITVDDIEKRAKLVAENGGTIVREPFDVMDVGRMAVIQDPTGAAVNFWQPKKHAGAERVNDVNCWCWNELDTRSPAKAKDFFARVLSWTYQDQATPQPYTTIMNQGRRNGGILDITTMLPEHVPAHWVVYFNVADLDATVGKARELGGTILVPPMDLSVGRFAVIRDPQGASFDVLQLAQVDD